MSRARRLAIVASLFAAVFASVDLASAQQRDGGTLARPDQSAPLAEAPKLPDSLRAWVQGLAPEEQRMVARRLRSMRPMQRRRFLRRWETASEQRLDRMKAHMEQSLAKGLERQRAQRERRAESLGIDPARLENNRRAWQSMGGDRQRRMRARLERFSELEPSQQEVVVSVQFADRSDAERARILQDLRAAADRLKSDSP